MNKFDGNRDEPITCDVHQEQDNNVRHQPRLKCTSIAHVVYANISSQNKIPRDVDFKLHESNFYNPTSSINMKGYKMGKKIAKTLQGSIWSGSFGKSKDIVIKITAKSLHNRRITILNGEKIVIKENIISEKNILKYLTNNIGSLGIKYMVSYIDFFDDLQSYYLVMTNGGSSLFNFVLKSHQCIMNGKLTINEWLNTTQILFKQMVTFIDILHDKMNICHMDISLENILINDVLITVDSTNNNKISFIPNFKVQFCDFGLAQKFDPIKNRYFLCNFFVGKRNYKSPEIYKKKPYFNAKLSDMWALGVCLFAMCIGSMPFNKPSSSDISYQWIMDGQIIELLTSWNKLQYINKQILDVLNKIFQKEGKRINMKQLINHNWLNKINNTTKK